MKAKGFFVHIPESDVCFSDRHTKLVNMMSLEKKDNSDNNSNSNQYKFPHQFTFSLNTCKTVFQTAHKGTQGQRWVVSKLLFAV